jgi:hypothetical protein
MDVERIIDDIRQLEEMFEAPDIRPLSASRRANICFQSTAGELKRQVWEFLNRVVYLSNLG